MQKDMFLLVPACMRHEGNTTQNECLPTTEMAMLCESKIPAFAAVSRQIMMQINKT